MATTNGYLSDSGVLQQTQEANKNTNDLSITANPQRSAVRGSGTENPRQYSLFVATFQTQDGDINASYVLGRADVSYTAQLGYSEEINNELLSFSTKNDNQNDIPTMTLRLSGMRSWEDLLLANDYVTLKAAVWGDGYDTVQSSVLMTGLISEVSKTYDASSGSVNYLVTCQSLAKIMANVTLTTFTEIAANGGYILQDIADSSNSATESDDSVKQDDDKKDKDKDKDKTTLQDDTPWDNTDSKTTKKNKTTIINPTPWNP